MDELNGVKQRKQTMPMISVIVPIYKVEEYLEKCINSILVQTYKNLEIILVNDGSPDKSGAICDSIAKSDKRIKVIHKENGGLSSARNAGIDCAKGEYIGFVDSDDSIEPIMYQKLMEALLDNGTKLAVCGVNYVFENGKKITKTCTSEDCTLDYYHAMVEMNMHRLFDMGACIKLYHWSLFEEIRFPIGKQSEDFYIMFKLFDKAQKISYVATPCYNYLQRRGSITKNLKINRDHEWAAYEQMQYLEEKYPYMSVLGHTAYASSALTVYDSYLKNDVKCPVEDIKHYKKVLIENKPFIEQADFLNIRKKLQFKLFGFNLILYNIVFKVYRKLYKV